MKIAVLLPLVYLFSCGESGKEETPVEFSPFEDFSISMVSNNAIGLSAKQPEACTIDVGFGPDETGMCATPIAIRARATSVLLLDSNNSKARVLGEGVGLDASAEWEGAAFELESKTIIKAQSTLEGIYDARPSFDRVSIELNFLRFKVLLGDDYWNVIMPFYSQPVESNAIVQSCQYSDGYLQAVAAKANLLGSLNFERGDFLFCLKAGREDCNLDEYRFFDTNSESFVIERPSAPKNSEYVANLDAGCAPSVNPEAMAKLDWGRFSLQAQLDKPRKIYADYAFGENSRNPDAEAGGSGLPPYKKYYFDEGGIVQSGNALHLAFELNTDNLVYLAGFADSAALAGASESEIARSLTIRPLHQSAADPNGTETELATKASVTVNLENKSSEELASARNN